jgi:hypothetical protein
MSREKEGWGYLTVQVSREKVGYLTVQVLREKVGYLTVQVSREKAGYRPAEGHGWKIVSRRLDKAS